MKEVQIINGPNLNLLGKQEPIVYGNASFEDYLGELRTRFPQYEISYYQGNVKGEIINRTHEVNFEYDGIILDAGAYAHISIVLHGAIKAVTIPIVEAYISNMHAHESFRHTLAISTAYGGVIPGFGLDSYQLTIESFM